MAKAKIRFLFVAFVALTGLIAVGSPGVALGQPSAPSRSVGDDPYASAPEPAPAAPASPPSAVPSTDPSPPPPSAPATPHGAAVPKSGVAFSAGEPISPRPGALAGVTVAKADAPAPTKARSAKDSSSLPPPPFDWNPKWAKFRTSEYFVTGAQGLLALASIAIPGKGRWDPKNSFDDGARKIFRATTLSGQREARDVSDALLVILVNQRLIDDLFVTWWYHDKGSVAYQLSLIDAETLTFAAAVQGLVAGISGRPRPYGPTTCNRPLEKQTSNCDGSNRYRSFFSGHASLSFTLAGLTCTHHAHLPLYGGGFPDAMACVGTMAAASTVAFMRVVSDQHNMTDILAGSAFGAAAGFFMPWVLHYRGGGTPEVKSDTRPKPLAITATLVPSPTGVSLMGSF